MTDGDALRRTADVVDALEDDTAVDVDAAQVLDVDDDQIRVQLTVAIPRGTDLEVFVDDQVGADEPRNGRRDEDAIEEVGEEADDNQPAPADEDEAGDEADEEYWCERCGYGPSSEAGVARHHGHRHDGTPSIITSPPDETNAETEPDQNDGVDEDLPAERVHGELLEMAENEGNSWVKASDLADRLGVTGQKIGHRLSTLRERGDVEKYNENAAVAVWRPTDADVPEPPVADEGEEDDTDETPEVMEPVTDAEAEHYDEMAEEHLDDETDTSTEDISTESESTSESESGARTGDLEEDVEPDTPDQDAGVEEQADDDDDTETFPRECHCGATLKGSLELAIHRTEDHGVPQSQFDNREPGEFEEIVRDADSVRDIIDETGWSSTKTLRVLGIYGLGDVVGPDGIEFSDLGDYEFDGVATVSETPNDPAGDEADEADDASTADRPEQRVANDGGAVAFQDYSASTGTTDTRCQNCGSHVDKQFAKVFEPEREGAPRCCPNCEDLVREGDGTIRPARNGGGS